MDLGRRQSWFHPQGASANSCPSAQTQTCCFSRGEKKKTKTRPNLARQRFAWTSEEYDYAAVYLCTSSLTSHRIASSRQALCGGLRARKVAKSRCERTQRRYDSSLWNIITILLPLSLSLSAVFLPVRLTLKQWERVGSLCWIGRCAQYMSSRFSMSSQTVENHFSRGYKKKKSHMIIIF